MAQQWTPALRGLRYDLVVKHLTIFGVPEAWLSGRAPVSTGEGLDTWLYGTDFAQHPLVRGSKVELHLAFTVRGCEHSLVVEHYLRRTHQ